MMREMNFELCLAAGYSVWEILFAEIDQVLDEIEENDEGEVRV